MWLPEHLWRNALLALAISASAGSLAACSGFTPVYGEHGIAVERHAFRYARPESRLDQIVYQELVLRLGRAGDPSSPTVRVATSSFTRDLSRSNVARVATQREAVVTANIELVDAAGKLLWSGSRSAAAIYTTDSQAFAEAEAAREATERAARDLAETIRLTLLGALARPAA